MLPLLTVQTLSDVSELSVRALSSKALALNVIVNQRGDVSTIFFATSLQADSVVMLNANLLQDKGIKGELRSLLGDTRVVKVVDEGRIRVALELQGLPIKGKFFDTCTAYQVLEAQSNKDLDFDLIQVALDILGEHEPLVQQLIRVQRSRRDSTANYFDRFNIKTRLLLELRESMVDILIEDGLVDTLQLELQCSKVISVLNSTGITVDVHKLNRLQKQWNGKCHKAKDLLHSELGAELKLDSPHELQRALNKHHDLLVHDIRLKDTKKNTIREYVTNAPILSSLQAYRESTAQLKAIESILQHEDGGKVFPQYDSLGTRTGRLSCKSPPLQATPKNNALRTCFIPSKGCKFIIADYSQIELRIAAEISGDRRMIRAFKDGVDLHSLTASILSGKEIDQVSAQERSAAKAVNFGVLFGMGVYGLVTYAKSSYGIDMTEREAKSFQKQFFREYPQLHRWVKEQARSTSWQTRTLGGRIRRWNKEPPVPELINSPIQGTAADIMKYALVLIDQNKVGTVVGCIHDEVILEVPCSLASDKREQLAELMVDAGERYLHSVPVVVDVDVTTSWI